MPLVCCLSLWPDTQKEEKNDRMVVVVGGGESQGGESADAQRELDRALIDHSFRKGRRGEERKGRGGLMEEREGGMLGNSSDL